MTLPSSLFVVQDELTSLLDYIKAEGNDLFKEAQRFDQAAEHYTAALLLGETLKEKFSFIIEPRLISSLYTNRAACCNKLVSDLICAEECMNSLLVFTFLI